MLVRTIILSVFVSMLASSVGIGYSFFYYQLFDFSAYLPLWKIGVILTFLSLFIAGLSWIFGLISKKYGQLVLSILISMFSIGSVMLPTMYPPVFPAEVELPEMFPAFVLPLHFIVPLIWLAISPYFLIEKK